MTDKRFTIKEFSTLNAMFSLDVICDNGIELPSFTACDLLNEQHETIERLKQNIDELLSVNVEEDLLKENEQLKQDNNALIHLLENQSIIIQELYSKLLEYQVKEPIVLTKEDLELMGKAVSYYTHGRCGE